VRLSTIAIVLALGWAGNLRATDGSDGVAMQSLLLPLEARAVGMGSAYVAVASGADSLSWNPAGMNQLSVAQAQAGHLAWVEGVNDEYLDVAMPIYGIGAWGLSMTYLYAQDQYYDDLGNAGGTFTDFDFSAKAAFSYQLADGMGLGLDYKILRQGYAHQFDMGSAFDFGWQWRDVVLKGFDLGAGLFNLGTPMALGQTSNNLPMDMKVGAAYRFGGLNTLAVDEEFEPIDSFNFLHFGGESGMRVGDWTVFGRAGYTFGPAQEEGNLAGLAVGCGVTYGSWQVDYAFTPQGDLGEAQRITLTWNAGD